MQSPLLLITYANDRQQVPRCLYFSATEEKSHHRTTSCTKCARQYVGETKWEFRYRMTEHLRDTRLNRDTSVANHYNQTGDSSENMLFQIIHILPSDPEDDRCTPRHRECEKYWIYQLHSLKPLGLIVF